MNDLPISDPAAEKATLGALLLRPELIPDVLKVAGPDAWWLPQHVHLVNVLADMHKAERTIDPRTVLDEVRKRGLLDQLSGTYLASLMERAWNPANAVEYAQTVAETHRARRVQQAAQRALQQVTGSVDDAVLTLAEAVDDVGSVDASGQESMNLDAFLSLPRDYDWLIDGLVERLDRVVVTGEEGGAKSWLLQQFAVCAAAGLHPFSFRKTKPIRVLLLDLENSPRLVGRRLDRLRDLARAAGAPVDPDMLRVECRPQGVDVTRPAGAAWFTGKVLANRPDLLVTGSLYRMHEQNINDELAARQLISVVDEVRTRARCAVMIEAHSPHPPPGAKRRDMRPAGSSLFKRSPECGIGLRPSKEEGVVDVVAWRGQRDDREWPAYLRDGRPSWPWVEHMPSWEFGRSA